MFNLGAALRARFAALGDPDDLESALHAYTEAVRATATASPDLPGMLTGLGAGHWDRYEQSGTPSDLEAALDAYERAVAATPAESSDAPGRMSNLGNAVSARHGLHGKRGDLETGRASYRHACDMGMTVDPLGSLHAASNWGRWADSRHSWEEAAEAYGFGLEAMDRLFRAQLLRRDKETSLAEAEGLPARAAFALAEVGETEAASVALERGRALLLSEALERGRSDLERLRDIGRANLVERYEEAAGRLGELARGELAPSDSPTAESALVAIPR